MIVQTVVPRDENNWSRKILSIWKVMTMMERGLKDNQRISFRRAEIFFFFFLLLKHRKSTGKAQRQNSGWSVTFGETSLPMPSSSSSSPMKLRIRYPRDRTSILKFPLDPQRDWRIGKVGRGGKKYEARERCRRFVVCMSSRRRTGAKRIPTPFRTFLASISRSCSFLYTHPRCTWGHPLQPSARQTTPTVTRITDSPPEKKHPLSAKMDYVEISSTRSSLVQFQTGFVSKKIQQHRLLYSFRSNSFVRRK